MNALHSPLRAIRAIRHQSPTILAMAALLPFSAPSIAADALGDAITGGKAGLELRYRIDHVEDDAFVRDANASTLRTRLNYVTGAWHDTTAFVELDNVSRLGDDRYFDLRNGKVMYPLVPDPDGTDLNQALLKYSGMARTVVTVGRQRINLDNQRFVGASPGRQNEQTYDALAVEYRGVENLVATVDYVARVNTVTGPEAGTPPAERESDMPLLNLQYTVDKALVFTGYHYAMDFADTPVLSNATTGLRLTGEIPVGTLKLGYTAEGAQQVDHARQPVDYRAGYWHGELKLSNATWNAALGHETLEDDGPLHFITPLATAKFHGLAEKFWQTPAGGMRDTWLKLGANVAQWKLGLNLHQLESDDGSVDWGNEADFTAFRAFGPRYSLLFVHADFNVDRAPYTNAAFPFTRFDDTRKTYLALMARY